MDSLVPPGQDPRGTQTSHVEPRSRDWHLFALNIHLNGSFTRSDAARGASAVEGPLSSEGSPMTDHTIFAGENRGLTFFPLMLDLSGEQSPLIKLFAVYTFSSG